MADFLFVATDDGVVALEREGRTWHQVVHSLTQHRVEALSRHGGVVLAGTTRGIYRTDDLAQTWQPASRGLTESHVRWLAHHPEHSGTVIAGTEPAAIFVSRNEGDTWRECPEVAELRDEGGWYLPYSPEAGCVRGLAFHGDRIYAAVEQGGLLRSDDAGESWCLVEGSSGTTDAPREGFIHPDVHSVEVHVSSPDLAFAPTGGGFYRSDDGGKRWTRLYDCYCRAVWVDPGTPDHLIMGPADSVDRNGRIEESSDGGWTWEATSRGLEVPWSQHMVNRFHRTADELLAVLSSGHLLSTPLETLSWRRVVPQISRVLDVAAMLR
jgi:photosystem II stability/assembly factor-like uncharacterized protein